MSVDKVPAENRWAIATQSLGGAIMATNKATLDAVGREAYDGIVAQIWGGAGQASKQIADALGASGDDAQSMAATAQLVATVMMGPEFEFETVEATPERAVVRCSECPWWNRTKELEISEDMCSVGDAAWQNALATAFSPNFAVSMTKAMPRGDEFCEWVWELQM